MTAIGIRELIVNAQARFDALAIGLAKDPGWLAAVTVKLAQNRFTVPLFDES